MPKRNSRFQGRRPLGRDLKGGTPSWRIVIRLVAGIQGDGSGVPLGAHVGTTYKRALQCFSLLQCSNGNSRPLREQKQAKAPAVSLRCARTLHFGKHASSLTLRLTRGVEMC